MKRLALVITIIVLFSIFGLVILGFYFKVEDLPTETYKVLLQLLVIGILGHVVSILITKANNERQELLAFNELRTSLLSRLNNSYIEVKKVRRITRATAIKKVVNNEIHYLIEFNKYHNCLQEINETQLELELITKDIESNAKLFSRKENLINDIGSMEKYLNIIIDEYENKKLKVKIDFDSPISTSN